jgi:hypothetical protein
MCGVIVPSVITLMLGIKMLNKIIFIIEQNIVLLSVIMISIIMKIVIILSFNTRSVIISVSTH